MKYFLCNETEKFELFYQNETKKKLDGNYNFVTPLLCKGEKQYLQSAYGDESAYGKLDGQDGNQGYGKQ